MANIVFAIPDRGTTVIEIVGRQTPFKTYYYEGQPAAFAYHLLPQLCHTSRSEVIHPTDETRGKCRGKLFVDIGSLERALSQALQSLPETNHLPMGTQRSTHNSVDTLPSQRFR